MFEQDRFLFPRPQYLERIGEGPTLGSPIREHRVDGLPSEGYELDLDSDGVTIRHTDANGLRYARATLDQIRSHSRERLPGLVIRDWPDFPVRGVLLDISRDRVPTRATLDRLVGLLALARFNQFQLYTEHTFAYRDHEVVWRDASPITPGDVEWLEERCREVGIELVPNQNCFGHMNRWLQHDAYRQRAEAPDGFELLPRMPLPPSVLAPTPENARFALSLFEELLPNFRSRRVNVGGDEPFELGRGVSRSDVARRGRTTVYLEHLRRIVDPLLAQGYEVQFWADVLRHDPGLAAGLPEGLVAGAWTYEAPRPDDELPDVAPDVARLVAEAGIDLDAHRGFARHLAPMAEVAIPIWVVPGTSSWNSLVGRIDNAVGNLVDAAEVGRARGCGGYIVTEWGDNGYLQPPSVGFGPLVFGGAVSWALDANRDLDLPAVLDRFVFADMAAELGGVLDSLGRLWGRTGQRAFNASPLQAALAPGQMHLITGDPDVDSVVTVVEELESGMAAIGRAAPAAVDGALVQRELVTAARLARHGAWRLLRSCGGPSPGSAALRADLAEAIEEQAACWLARSRPGGLEDSLAHLRPTVAEYEAESNAPVSRRRADPGAG